MNITKKFYTVECFENGERCDFMRGWNVHADPGHHYYAEFETIEEARSDIRRLADEFFMRDGGDYDRILDEQGEEAANKARADFVASGYIDDDLNFYGIREFERINLTREEIANILADRERADFAEVCAALDRFGVAYETHDVREFQDDDDALDAAIWANEDVLGDVDNAKIFAGVCD